MTNGKKTTKKKASPVKSGKRPAQKSNRQTSGKRAKPTKPAKGPSQKPAKGPSQRPKGAFQEPLQAPASESSELMRLQKVLAEAGMGSRRACETLIAEGRVDIDGVVVTQLGTKVDPGTQRIRVDGEPLKRKNRRYFAVHKPPGVLSTSKDQWRRARVIDLVNSQERLFTIGRLDMESSGLILVTNDGNLANRLTHPRYGVKKTYQVTVAGVPSTDVLRKLRGGVVLSDGRVKPESIIIKKRLKQSSILEVVLTEGRNREIRRMLARFDHKVVQLRRVAIGCVRLADLPSGAHRELTRTEVKGLRMLAEGQELATKKKPKKATTPHASKATQPGKGKTAKPARRKTTLPAKKKARPTAPKTGAIIGGSAAPATGKRSTRRTPRRK